MKAILAIQNRTDPQNATLRQLMEWQQKIILLGRSHALKAQQQQIPQQQVQQQPNEPQPAAQSQQPRVTNGEAATGSVQITNPQPQTQQLQHQQMSAVGHDTSATGGLGESERPAINICNLKRPVICLRQCSKPCGNNGSHSLATVTRILYGVENQLACLLVQISGPGERKL